MSALVPLLVTLPLLGAAVALIAGRHRRAQVAVSVVTLTLVMVIAAVLLVIVDAGDAPIAVSVGNWPIPFGIVLYVDRLAALLVVVSSIVLLAVLLFSVGQGAADGDDDTPGLDLPPVVPDPRGGHLHRVHRGRPVQPLRRLRDPARGVVRADHAGQHRVAHPHRRRLHRRLARLVDPLPRLDRRDLRSARHREHGADLRADERAAAGDPDGAAHAAALGLQHQGGRLPAVVLAARQLPDGAGARHGGVRRPADEGRRVRDDPHRDADLPRERRQLACC